MVANFININVIIFLLLSCSKKNTNTDDILTIPKTQIFSNQKLNGFYYRVINDKYINILFFYKNGIYTDYGASTDIAILNDENKIKSHIDSLTPKIKSLKYCWGTFVIDDSILKINFWDDANVRYKAFIKECIIKNDSSFTEDQVYRLDNNNKTELGLLNNKYFFHKFSPKPDSTNDFIK